MAASPFLTAVIYYGEKTRAQSAKGEGAWSQAGGKETFPVGSRGTRLVSPAGVKCHLPGKLA